MLTNLPIMCHHEPRPSRAELAAADQLAQAIERENSDLRIRTNFRALVPTTLEDAPTLHIDDLTAIHNFEGGEEARFYQERARLRAYDGDVVATSLPIADGYEEYCTDYLGLGSVRWLHPRPLRNPLRLAEACWEDPAVRGELVRLARVGKLRYLHPHMGTLPVWELASLIRSESGRPIHVIAPPPRLSTWVNDKVRFTELVRRLFGSDYVPNTRSAGNFATLSKHVKQLASNSTAIGIKLADSAGGGGTVVLDARKYTSRNLGDIYEELMDALRVVHWDGRKELLIDSWETDILSCPSSQLWIPPIDDGKPVVEGIFAQAIEGQVGVFVGSAPAELPDHLMQEITNRSWLLARIFQRLGYVGRCSFDMLLVGRSLEGCQLEFIECNGRWGGTSAPMTLMNRVFGDWQRQPYVSKICELPGLESRNFSDVLDCLSDSFYVKRSGRGRLLASMPGRLVARSAIDLIAIGRNTEDANSYLQEALRHLQSQTHIRKACLTRRPPTHESTTDFVEQ